MKEFFEYVGFNINYKKEYFKYLIKLHKNIVQI